jgi:hypothetical protein
MASDRDTMDVGLTTTLGLADLKTFTEWTEELM